MTNNEVKRNVEGSEKNEMLKEVILKEVFAKLILQTMGCCVYMRSMKSIKMQATAALHHQTQPQLEVSRQWLRM